MARGAVLNPNPWPLELEPLTLAKCLLSEAHGVTDASECGRLDPLSGQLGLVSPESIEGDRARTVFWLNLYNALILHRLCLRPVRGSVLMHLRMFDRVAYKVGGDPYPLSVIEHGVLRRNRRPPLRLRRALGPADARLRASPGRLDPRIHFALNCGARSCPPVRSYDPDRLDAQLERATASYLQAESTLEPERRRVTLPRLMRIYRADFGRRREQLEFAARYLPAVSGWIGDGAEIRIGYGRFDWTATRPASA
jgi:Protein of unknown function, DUF547